MTGKSAALLATADDDPLTALIARFSLSPPSAALARAILSATSGPAGADEYTAACAVYIATATHSPKASLPLSTLLNPSSTQLRITHFFTTAKSLAASVPSTTPSDPARLVHLAHRAFMVTADVWRKLTDLFSRPRLLQHLPTQSASNQQLHRLAWLLFLVCKAHVSSPVDSTLTSLNGFHLMLTVLLEAGFVVPPEDSSSTPQQALCTATGALTTEIDRFRAILLSALPPVVTSMLPIFRLDGPTPDLAALCIQLDEEYTALLATVRHRLDADERVFIDAPHLLSDTPSPHTPDTPPPIPRKRRLSDAALRTPRTRLRLIRDRMPVTPTTRPPAGARPTGDALDALAAVACTAPPSPLAPMRAAQAVTPTTPVSVALEAVNWLRSTADARPEIRDPTGDPTAWANAPPDQLPASASLRRAVPEESEWADLVLRVRSLTNALAETCPAFVAVRKRQAVGVYFAVIDAILEREAKRLRACRARFDSSLVRNALFHKGVLALACECTSAAYGNKDMSVFWSAIETFGLSAFDVTKVVESFVQNLRDMPKSLSRHVLMCDQRLLESKVWEPDSQLVKILTLRAEMRAAEEHKKAEVESNNNSDDSEEGENKKQERKSPNGGQRWEAKEFALEVFYKKVLMVASNRAQELLMLLGFDSIAESVWACIKCAVWQQWRLLIGRHLDQIVLCCVYGVAKVRLLHPKFRTIISTYRTMRHVREPSFAHLIPNLFRDMSLHSFDDITASTQPESTGGDGAAMRGDIIRFYNQVFITALKPTILAFEKRENIPPAPTAGMSTPGSRPESASTTPDSTDRLKQTVMNSPMRVLHPQASPRQIGRVTVSAISPTDRAMVRLRQSPSRPSIAVMTPGTRTLYAFGESPVANLDIINQSIASSPRAPGESPVRLRNSSVHRPVPLNFEGRDSRFRSATIRRRYADVIGQTALSRAGGVRMVAGPDGSTELKIADVSATSKAGSEGK